MGGNGETRALWFKEMKLGHVGEVSRETYFSLFKEGFSIADSQGGTGCLSAATTEKDQVPAENQTGWNLSVPMRNPPGLSHGCEEECEDRRVLFPGWARTMGQ